MKNLSASSTHHASRITIAVGLSLLVALTARTALPQPDLLLQIHFAGAQKISADPHASAFTNEFCSPAALALRDQTATKLSAWLANWLPANLNTAPVPGGAAKLRPLFDDFQRSEFFLEVRAAANGKPEAAIAIKLDPARAQLWQTGLKSFFATATFKSMGGWLVFDSNPALLGLGDKLAQRLAAPPAGWLELDINWPRLAQWHPKLKELSLPETQFSLTAPGDVFNLSGKFFFSENLALNLEPWQMPTNDIHVPFSSFTAVRGFAPWWQSQPWARPYKLSPAPNQLISWALPVAPFQTFASVPVPDAANALAQAYERLAPVLHAASAAFDLETIVEPVMGQSVIDFRGVNFVIPRLRALNGPAGQFLLAELFPNSAKSQPLPPELFQRLATKDLVFYHYEVTGARLPQVLNLTQLGLMLTRHQQLQPGLAAFKWVQQTAGTNLVFQPVRDHTDTEITQSGPAEFTFARKSPVIFTAFELYALANWLEAPNFPGCDLKMPPPPERMMQIRRQQLQSAPVPTPRHSP